MPGAPNKKPKVRRVKSRFFQELESLPLSVLYAKSLYLSQLNLTNLEERQEEIMDDYLKIANDPVLWLMCLPIVVLVGFQAVLFTQKSFKSASIANLTKSQCLHAFRAGAISAIGPAIAVFIVMLGMMAVVGAPVTWMRLAIIGAAPTELTASAMGAQAMDVEFGGPGYGVLQYANSVWAMALNGCGWLLFCGLFTHKLESFRNKMTGGNTALMAQVGGAAMLGTLAYLTTGHLLAGSGRMVAAVAAGFSMAILVNISKKFRWLTEYNLGIAMVIGMFASVLIFGY
jgi:hypothetical protein